MSHMSLFDMKKIKPFKKPLFFCVVLSLTIISSKANFFLHLCSLYHSPLHKNKLSQSLYLTSENFHVLSVILLLNFGILMEKSTIILCLIVFFLTLSLTHGGRHPAAKGAAKGKPKPRSRITVIGTVYCDICSNNTFSRHSYFLPGKLSFTILTSTWLKAKYPFSSL